MERIAAVFHFTEKYQTLAYGPKEEATVKLDIDYRSKTFSITPPYGADKFKFCQTSKDYKKWIAVLNCIQKAIEFANEEIGVTSNRVQSA